VSIVGKISERISFQADSFKGGEFLQVGDAREARQQVVGSGEGTKISKLLDIIESF